MVKYKNNKKLTVDEGKYYLSLISGLERVTNNLLQILNNFQEEFGEYGNQFLFMGKVFLS